MRALSTLASLANSAKALHPQRKMKAARLLFHLLGSLQIIKYENIIYVILLSMSLCILL